MRWRSLSTATALAAAMVLGVGTARAVPISAGSALNLTGHATFSTTAITFSNPVNSPGGNTGDFSVFAACTGCATMAPPSGGLTYSPFTAGEIFSITEGVDAATFDATSGVSVTTAGSTPLLSLLTIVDDGTLALTGFDATPGQLALTLNETTGALTGSFSATTIATATAVPEPAGIAVLAVGLIGLMEVVRRRSHRRS